MHGATIKITEVSVSFKYCVPRKVYPSAVDIMDLSPVKAELCPVQIKTDVKAYNPTFTTILRRLKRSNAISQFALCTRKHVRT